MTIWGATADIQRCLREAGVGIYAFERRYRWRGALPGT